MFVRVFISVDASYVPAPISVSVASLVWLLGFGWRCCYQRPHLAGGRKPSKPCQAESRHMRTRTGGVTNRSDTADPSSVRRLRTRLR
jgi:hypothetical protein